MDKEWQVRSNRSPEPKETTCVPEFEQIAPATQQRPWESNARVPQNKNHMAKTNSRVSCVRVCFWHVANACVLRRRQRGPAAIKRRAAAAAVDSRAPRRSVCGDAAETPSASARTGAHAYSHTR